MTERIHLISSSESLDSGQFRHNWPRSSDPVWLDINHCGHDWVNKLPPYCICCMIDTIFARCSSSNSTISSSWRKVVFTHSSLVSSSASDDDELPFSIEILLKIIKIYYCLLRYRWYIYRWLTSFSMSSWLVRSCSVFPNRYVLSAMSTARSNDTIAEWPYDISFRYSSFIGS